MLRSVDSVSEENGMHHAYPAEFLQQLNAGGLPPALLCLKVGSPVILLRNLDPGEGLCNGTRMVVLNVRRKCSSAGLSARTGDLEARWC